MNKKRCLDYEKKFKSYLFSFDYKTHLEIIKNVGLDLIKYRLAYNIFMEYWDSLPDEEKPKINKRLIELGL